MKDIHRTLTDAEGNTYKVHPSWWVRTLTLAASVNFVILLGIVAWLISNTQTLDTTSRFTEKAEQRYRAIAEFTETRAKAGRWTYDRVCEMMTAKGQECLDNPQWYADPVKYPAIANDPMGLGLFPPNK